jgi:Immunity protein 50
MMTLEQTYLSIPGGEGLLKWYGDVPSFHDAEIVALNLNRRSPSTLLIHLRKDYWAAQVHYTDKPVEHAVVTFRLEDIAYVELDGFSQQNVIGGLAIRQAVPHPEQSRFYGREGSPEDYEIVLEPCFGLDGLIRCRRVAILLALGMPDDVKR